MRETGIETRGQRTAVELTDVALVSGLVENGCGGRVCSRVAGKYRDDGGSRDKDDSKLGEHDD